MVLSILSWNVRGIMSSAYPLSCMLNDHNVDIAVVCAHKLFTHSKHFLESINSNYVSLSVEDCSQDSYYINKCDNMNIFEKMCSVMTRKIFEPT